MADDRPLGLFDSGVGGLTVVKELKKILPNESLVYFGDTARCPYGPRPAGELREIALSNLRFLLQYDIKLLLVACNTSTAAALDLLEERSPVPVLGVIGPGAKAAALRTKRSVGVIATETTIESGAYQQAILAANPDIRVIAKICSPFVPMIESEAYLKNPGESFAVVKSCLEPLTVAGIDTLVLGCTHYPVLLPMIRRVLPVITVVDPSKELALEAHTVLTRMQRLSVGPGATEVYYTSGDPEVFARIGGRILGRPLGRVLHHGG